MDLRKLISLWALLALMFGQIALAEHSVSHIDHGFFQELTDFYDGHDGHEHDEDDQKHDCPECLLVQSLQTAFYNASVISLPSLEAENLTIEQQSLMIAVNRDKANSPRAPPLILI